MKPIGQILPRVVTDLVRASPLSPGKVDFAWRAAVGTSMSRVSSVRLEKDVLLVEAQTPHWAAAIMRASPIILERLRGTLGPETVRVIRLRS